MTDNTTKEWLETSINKQVLDVIETKYKKRQESLEILQKLIINSMLKGRYRAEETFLSFGLNSDSITIRFILTMIMCPENHHFYQFWWEDVKKEKRKIVLSFHVRKTSFSDLMIKNINFSEYDNDITKVLRNIQYPKIQEKFLVIAKILLLKLDPLSQLSLISTIRTSQTLISLTTPKKRERVVEEGPKSKK
jgi:hypothetical protein